jgi:hypothetical protein
VGVARADADGDRLGVGFALECAADACVGVGEGDAGWVADGDDIFDFDGAAEEVDFDGVAEGFGVGDDVTSTAHSVFG